MISETEKLAIEVEDMPFKGWSTDIGTRVAAELRRLAAVEQELEALKRAISDAEPIAWSTGINWHPIAHHQSEQVQKLTRKSQPEHGFTEPLYTLKGIK